MRLTQRQKIDGYDQVTYDRDMLSLAVHDLVNHKFGLAVTRFLKDYDTSEIGSHGRYTVAMSWRAMPLFLIRYVCGGQDVSVRVMSEANIQDMYRKNPRSAYARAIESARNELTRKYLDSHESGKQKGEDHESNET